MASPESSVDMTPLEYLKQADVEIAAGNDQRAAALLWKATEAIFMGLARERGLSQKDLYGVAKVLEEERPQQKHYYSGNFLFAESLRDHGIEDPLERYELEPYILEDFMDGVREFILEQHGPSE